MDRLKLKNWQKEINDLKEENRLLINQQQEWEVALANIRQELVMDFHDHLGSQVARLAMLAQATRERLNNPSTETVDALIRIQQLSIGISESIKDFIWTIDPKNDNLKEVFLYLKDFGEELFEHTEIKFFTVVDDMKNLNRNLFHSHSRHLIPIFKEGLANCFKHALCQKVTLAIEVGEKEFTIKLEDDGKGFEKEGGKETLGIKNIYKRANEMHCHLKINSIRGKGTLITLKGLLP